MESFMKYASDASGKKILYQDYVNKMTKENETHTGEMVSGFDKFDH